MDSAKLMDVANGAVAAAKKAGADHAEAYLDSATEFRCRVREGAPDLVKQANRRGLGLRVFVGGKVGFVNTSDLRPDSIKTLAERAVTLARVGEADPFAGLPDEGGQLKTAAELEVFDPAIVDLPTDRKIEMARQTEAAAREADPRVTSVEGTSFSSTVGTNSLANSGGWSRQYRFTSAALSTRALCKDKDGKQQSGGSFSVRRHLADLDSPEAIGREAAQQAVEMLGPVKITTRKAPVLMHPDIAVGWMGNIAGAFSGDQVFKKASWLADKMGETIGAAIFSLVDDGTMKRAIGTGVYDGEGVATQRNVLVEKGVVRTFLYDSYTARKAQTKSTGNAARSYDSVPGIGNNNLYVENGTSTLEEMLNAYGALFYMKDRGAFGYNPTTGDYSYQAAGLWVEKGAVVHPVTEVTVASNSLTMLKGLVKIGNDLKFLGSTGSPHLLIDEMTISGA